jgi:transposase
MAKSAEKLRAREMRRNGKSIKEIARVLNVSRASASVWCADILLTKEQIERLENSKKEGGIKGSRKGALIQHQRKVNRMRLFEKEGRIATRRLNLRDLNMIGIGLYLGEGSKRSNRFYFVNSDPGLIWVVMEWLKKVFHIQPEDFYLRVMINEIHQHRDVIVKKEWSRITGIPMHQFRKTVFIRAKNKKIYENADRYLGVMGLYVRKSSMLQYRILGLMKGLVYNIGYRSPA